MKRVPKTRLYTKWYLFCGKVDSCAVSCYPVDWLLIFQVFWFCYLFRTNDVALILLHILLLLMYIAIGSLVKPFGDPSIYIQYSCGCCYLSPGVYKPLVGFCDIHGWRCKSPFLGRTQIPTSTSVIFVEYPLFLLHFLQKKLLLSIRHHIANLAWV